jgi:hypothetical protein
MAEADHPAGPVAASEQVFQKTPAIWNGEYFAWECELSGRPPNDSSRQPTRHRWSLS